jgi:hypothetical protein
MKIGALPLEGVENTFSTDPAAAHESARIVSALNGRVGADIIVPRYQDLIETDYLPPNALHWTQECRPVEAENTPEHFEYVEVLQTRKLSLRVF